MDLKGFGTKAVDWIKKYRYAVLILVIGVALMLIPGKKNTQQSRKMFFSGKERTCTKIDERKRGHYGI